MLTAFKRRLKNLTSACPIRGGRTFQWPAWTTAPPVKRLFKCLFYTLATLAVLITILLCFAIDDTPQPKILQGLNRDDIQRAKQLLHVAPEDRQSVKTVSLNQKDLNIALSYLLNHFAENTAYVQIMGDRLVFQIAIFVPKSPWGRYLDFSFSLIQIGDTIRIKSFKIGEISIPDPAANKLIPFIVLNTSLNRYWQLASQYVKNIHIGPQTMDISYLGTVIDAAKQLAIQKHREYPSLHLYQQQINDIVSRHDPEWRLSLIDLLQPLFLSAYQRSNDDTAISENRAVIIAVSSYIYKRELRSFLPIGLIYNKEYPVFAYKRIDIPQHFIASALVTSVDSSLLSEQMGVDKEIGDSQQGSGFSFIDLSADRAGIRFGQLAIASPQQARELQRIMSTIKDYSAIIPNIQDLPEHMDEPAFKRQYTEVGSPAYQEVVAKIDARIDSLPLYRNR